MLQHSKKKDTRIPILIRFDDDSSTQFFEDHFIRLVNMINFDENDVVISCQIIIYNFD